MLAGVTGGDLVSRLLVKPGEPAGLAERDPGKRLGLPGKSEVEPLRTELLEQLRGLQERLWAESSRSVLLVLQGLDTSGKDGTIEHVFSGVNPQGIHDASFKPPTPVELAHDYLWRVHQACPSRGEIGIFNRSHYEDIVTVRVLSLASDDAWRRRYQHLREWERMLTDEGTTIVKVFLHISKEEQRARLQARLDDPAKRWKFRSSDLDSRARWADYMAAYEDALTETSTEWAPWYVVPADRRWVRNVAVSQLLVKTLERLDPQFPEPEDLSGMEIV
jgi:PPK2 family polyphosphate:nucleotide phosphotransferase